MARITLRIPSSAPVLYCWLVLVGYDARIEHELWMPTPCEQAARLALGIPLEVPILVGRA